MDNLRIFLSVKIQICTSAGREEGKFIRSSLKTCLEAMATHTNDIQLSDTSLKSFSCRPSQPSNKTKKPSEVKRVSASPKHSSSKQIYYKACLDIEHAP